MLVNGVPGMTATPRLIKLFASRLSGSIGADFHRAMVATVPGEKLLLGRRPVRN